MFKQVLAAAATLGFVGTSGAEVPAPLPVEPTGVIEQLPERYPDSWFLVQDASFFHMSDGKTYVIDTSQDSVASQVQGTFNIVAMGNMFQAPSRQEIYATETFHTRGTRGTRIDVLTIWDTATLSPKGEVILPQGKRFMGMPERNVMKLLNGDKWLAIFNLSPATSVTLVDLDTRELMGEIATPGCSFLYPAGSLGFSSLCADGRFLTVLLNEDGTEKSRKRSDVFFDSDTTPIFERAPIVGKMGYFPSFKGLLHPVDFSGDVARPAQAWSMAADDEGPWAASGIGIDGEDALGRIYFLMNPEAAEIDGAHNAGGSEIWIFDPKTQQRVQRITLQEWGLSFAVNRSETPQILVTNPVDMSVELYDVASGEFIRKITAFGQETPLFIQGAQ